MKRTLLSTLILTLTLGLFATPALAVDPVAVSLHPSFSWLNLAGDTVKYLPPGSVTDTTKVIVGQPYAGFWLFAVIDTLAPAVNCTLAASIGWRARVKHPRTNTPYWLPWAVIPSMVLINVPDSLYWAPVWADDSLGWFDDLQFRVFDTTATNDSSKIRLWLVKRYRR